MLERFVTIDICISQFHSCDCRLHSAEGRATSSSFDFLTGQTRWSFPTRSKSVMDEEERENASFLVIGAVVTICITICVEFSTGGALSMSALGTGSTTAGSEYVTGGSKVMSCGESVFRIVGTESGAQLCHIVL